MNEYISLKTEGQAEYTDRKSVFLAFAAPVSSEQEALSFISRIKNEYIDARHHVYAYVLRELNCTRYSDDREPHGTAGLPVLDILRKGNITDAVLVVVRYFGGVLLGTGGLVKAYSTAAKAAVDAAQKVRFSEYSYFHITVSYPDYQKLIPILARGEIRTEQQDFSENVTLLISCETKISVGLLSEMTELCAGRLTYFVEKTEIDSRIF